MQVEEVKEPSSAWFQYIKNGPSSCLSHDPRRGKVFYEVFRHRPVYLQVEEANKLHGVLSLAMISSWLFGRFAVSMPYLNHGGICASSPRARDALLGKAVELAKGFKARWMELRHEAPVDWPLAVRQHEVSADHYEKTDL